MSPARIGTVRYPRIVPKDEGCAKKLKKRTLTNLYNERPTWLDLAHRRLDEVVAAAYGWTDLDLGHYERFLDESLTKDNNVTTGQVYNTIITRERRGGGGEKYTLNFSGRNGFAAHSRDLHFITQEDETLDKMKQVEL